jgi:hypothetical protein
MYSQLPKEIRLQILTYTDLVTPNLEVEWNTVDKYQLRINPRDSSMKTNHPCTTRVDICYCSLHLNKSTANTTKPARCFCWKPPISFFLISKQLREDAMEIFFGHNRFVFTPASLIYHDPKHSKFQEHALRDFLEYGVPHEALSYLRDLEMIFVIVAPVDLMIDTRLKVALINLKDELNLKPMTIMIRLLDNGPSPSWIRYGGARDKDGETLFDREKWGGYLDLIRRPFKQAKNLYVNVTWSYKQLPGERSYQNWWAKDEIPFVEAAEAEAERYVMGEEYTSKGKAEYKESSWIYESRMGKLFTGNMPGPGKQRRNGVIKYTVK